MGTAVGTAVGSKGRRQHGTPGRHCVRCPPAPPTLLAPSRRPCSAPPPSPSPRLVAAFVELNRSSSPAAAAAAGVVSCGLRALPPARGDACVAVDGPQPFGPDTPSRWGWERFVPLADLARLLDGDRLLLRADVAVGLDP